tara:strand:- start:1674 stop:4292 length:2619 start_codon:yes stop_codon:yes gene_type:complete
MAILSSLFNIGTEYPSAPPQGVAITQQKLAEEISPFYKDLLAKSQALFDDRTDEGFIPFTGPTMAPFTPQQEQAFTGIESLVGTQAPQFQEATDLVRGTTQEFTPEVAQGLMSPFQQAVTDIEKRESQRNFEANVLPKVRQAQIAQGSFGGTRGSLLEAEALRNQQQQLGDIQAKGSLQAYQDAQNIFKDQAAREAAAAGQLATFAPAQYKASVGELGALQSVGEEQQRQQQSALDEAYRQFLEEKRFPEDTLGRYQATVQGFPALRQEISKVTPPQPSMANQLIGGLGTIGSLYGAYGGFSPGGFGSALPGFGMVNKASGGLVSLQQGDSVGRAMNDELMQQGNVAAQNRELDQMNQRNQLKAIEPELINRFVGEYYAKMNAADKSEEGLKSFLDEFGVGGTQRRMAEALDLPMLPAQSAPFRVDEEAMETGIPPAGMALSYEELEDRYLTGAGYSPLERDTEESGGLSGIFDKLIGRAQGGPILYRKTPGDLQATGRYGKYGTSDVPQALLQFGVSIEELFRRPPDQIVGLYDSLANKPGGGEARYFIRQNFPQLKDQLQIDFTDEDRYGALGRYLPKRGDVQNVISGIGNVVDRVTSQPIEDTVGDIVGKYESITKKIPESKKDTEKKEDKDDTKQITEVADGKVNKELGNLDKFTGLQLSIPGQNKSLVDELRTANEEVIKKENKILDKIAERDAKLAERIKDAPQQVKTDLFALAAEKFTNLMQSTEKTVPAIAKELGDYIKEGTGIGKEAQARELDLENMAVDSLKDQAKVLSDRFTRTGTIVAGELDKLKIYSDLAVKQIEAYGDKAMDLIKVMKDLKGMLPQGDALISRDGGEYFTSLAEDILNQKKTVKEVMAELDAASKPSK